ncbi:MAG: AAA family ATPase, partial [Planctomycetota bacterium]
MRISSVHLERFGNRDHLHLDGLSETLNVVFGPNGSGKSATIGFIRWMLYGGSENARRSDQHGAPATARGRLILQNRGRQQTVARQDDGTRYGRVYVDGVEHLGVETNHLVPLLADITLHDFDRIFAPNFDQEQSLSSLLQSAQARGVNLATTRLPSDRTQELRLRIQQVRRDMERLPWQGQALTQLIDRRDTLQRRIAALEEDHQKRRGSVQAEFEDLNRQINLRESDIERLRGDWHAKDNEVAGRRRALEEAWRRAEEAKQEYIRKLRNDLADVETHLTRARGMLAEMRQRYERVDTDLRDYESQRPYGDQHEAQRHVESIARQLDELRIAGIGRPAVPDAYRQNAEIGWQASQANLDRLRSEISRLSDTLQQRREGEQAEKLSGELQQLSQCEDSTARWVDELGRQRNQLADELEQAERFGVSLVLDQT